MDLSIYPNSKLTYTSYNQCGDCVIFGTKLGFYVYTINPRFQKIISRQIPGGVSIVKMLYKSNIIVFSGNVDKGLYPNNKLIIWDDIQGSVLGEITYKTKLVNIHVTKEIIAVVTNTKIYIYKFKDLKILKTIDTIHNDGGLSQISYSDNNSIIVFPGNKTGTIEISDIHSNDKSVVQMHEHKINNICIDSSGLYIATASINGTIIRIYDIKNKVVCKEVRRGSDPLNIINITLSDNLSYLACTSARGSIHVFNTGINRNVDIDNTSFNIGFIKSFLPAYFSSEWSFAQLVIDGIVLNPIFVNDKTIVLIGNDGCYYKVLMDKYKIEIDDSYKFISDSDDPFSERSLTIK